MQRCQNMGTVLRLPPYQPKPKMCLSIDVGERQAGLTIGWQRSAMDPVVTLWEDNINLFPNHPISIEYFHVIYGTARLPPNVRRWDEVFTLEDALSWDIRDYKKIQDAINNYVPTRIEQAVARVEGEKRTRAKSKMFQVKRALVELFFDTSRDKNYLETGIMNRSTFETIPDAVSDKGRIMRKNIYIYAQYFAESFGKMDIIFIEEQNQRFGEQGKHDEETFRATLERVFPEPDTKYLIYSGSKKKNVYPLSALDVAELGSQRLWKPDHFFSLGPSGRLVYNHKKIPKPKRGVLEKYQFLPEPVAPVATPTTFPSVPLVAANLSKKRSRETSPFLLERLEATSNLLNNGAADSQDLETFCAPLPKKRATETQFGDIIDLDDEEDEELKVLSSPPPPRQPAPQKQDFSVSHILSKFRVLEPH